MIVSVPCIMDECHSCPGGEWDEEDDYGVGMGEWVPCKCDCHKAKANTTESTK